MYSVHIYLLSLVYSLSSFILYYKLEMTTKEKIEQLIDKYAKEWSPTYLVACDVIKDLQSLQDTTERFSGKIDKVKVLKKAKTEKEVIKSLQDTTEEREVKQKKNVLFDKIDMMYSCKICGGRLEEWFDYCPMCWIRLTWK